MWANNNTMEHLYCHYVGGFLLRFKGNREESSRKRSGRAERDVMKEDGEKKRVRRTFASPVFSVNTLAVFLCCWKPKMKANGVRGCKWAVTDWYTPFIPPSCKYSVEARLLFCLWTPAHYRFDMKQWRWALRAVFQQRNKHHTARASDSAAWCIKLFL